MDKITIKRLLLARVFELRRNAFTYASLNQPQSVQDDDIVVDGQTVKRRRITLTAHGCKVATCTMCPLPDEAVADSVPVTLNHWMAQIKGAIGPADDIHTLTLFHNGNYFSDREVPSLWRATIHEYLRDHTGIQHLVVESLPQYLTRETLMFARDQLDSIKLNVAIGLQSSNKLVRELCIMSTCGSFFEPAVKLLKTQGDDAQVFLMFGAAFLNEFEAAYDLQSSIEYCHGLGITPTICPLQVAPNTLVADLVARGLYEPPRSSHLLSVLHETKAPVRVAVSLFKPDDPWREAFMAYNRDPQCSPNPMFLFPFAWPDEPKILARMEEYLRQIALDKPGQTTESPVK